MLAPSTPTKICVALEGVLVRNPDLVGPTGNWVQHAEHVEMVVQPTHGVLNGHVEVPERGIRGDFDPASDRWLNLRECHP